MNFFKIVSISTALLFAFLFTLLLFRSESFVNDLGLQAGVTSSILARRTSIFMLGITVLMFGSRNLSHSKARQIICMAIGFTMFGLACMGSYEFIRGTVNSSILTAMTIETTLAVSYGIVWFKNRKIDL